MRIPPACALLGPAFVLLASACVSTPADIRDANEAARTGETGTEARTNAFGATYGPVYPAELRPGDCFDDDGQTFELGQVLKVPCEGYHTHQVLDSVYVEIDGGWPGDAFFEAEAVIRCDPRLQWFIFPSADTWFVGDRTILCLKGP